MKKLLYIIIPLVLLISGFEIWHSMNDKDPARVKHNIIMQITQSDSLTQLAVIGQVRNLKSALPDSRIEVVCHANGLDMLIRSRSKVSGHIAELRSQDVVFAACENTMKRKKIQTADLVPGVVTVPSALAEIVLRQEDGWSYVKGGN